MSFKDYFSHQAAGYARFRPRYPTDLFSHLASLAPSRTLAWDCGTGNGQAAVGLAGYFERVVATDASGEQLAHAEPHPRVTYRQGAEGNSGLGDAEADLVTAAQALHWFDPDAFYAEVRRVLVSGGVIAVWCYGLLRVGREIDRLLDRFTYQTVGPYWAPERRHVETGYRDLPFPFDELPFPACAMEVNFTLDDLAGFLDTWSAVRRYREAVGEDPVPRFVTEVAPLWGEPGTQRPVRWAITGRLGRYTRRS